MAQFLGVAHRTYASYERNERVPDADLLRSLVARENVGAHWLLTGEGSETEAQWGVREERAVYAAVSQDLSVETLSIALELADEALRGLWLPRREYAELVAGVYAMLQQGLPYADILELSRPATKKAGKQGDGDDDPSETSLKGHERARGK